MTRGTKAALIAAVLSTTLWGSRVSEAEWQIDLYGGASRTSSTDLKVKGTDDTGASVLSTVFDIETDTGFTFGLRGGYWFESLPIFGVGFDFFYYSIPVPSQTTTASATFTGSFLGQPITVSGTGQLKIPSTDLPGLAFSPELRLRWPFLVTPDMPKGRLQPYITAGPAWGFTVEGENAALSLGGKVGGGVAYQFAKYFAVFGEYRYTFFPKFELSDRRLDYTTELNTHSLIVGVSLKF